MDGRQIIELIGGFEIFKRIVDFQEITDKQYTDLLKIYDKEIVDKKVQDAKMYILLQLNDIALRFVPDDNDLRTRLSDDLFDPRF